MMNGTFACRHGQLMKLTTIRVINSPLKSVAANNNNGAHHSREKEHNTIGYKSNANSHRQNIKKIAKKNCLHDTRIQLLLWNIKKI